MKIFAKSTTQRSARLGVLCGMPAQHEHTGLPTVALRGGRPSGLPMSVAPMSAPWQRQATDAGAVRTYALSTIKPNAVAGVRPGLRSSGPPV